MRENFCDNLNTLFKFNAPELRIDKDENYEYFIYDDKKNKIHTLPVLEYEERFLSQEDSECFLYLYIVSHGKYSELIKIESTELFKSETYIKKFGNTPFAAFSKASWNIFFETIDVMLTQIEQRIVYKYLGWNKSLDKYIYGNLLIDPDFVFPINSSLTNGETVCSEIASGVLCKNINDIISGMFNNKINGYILIIYLLHAHYKQRLVLLYRICPEFVIEIVGETGSRKTSTSKAVFNTADDSVSSFEDTYASIRRMLQGKKSGVTIIDDYKISNKKNDEKFEAVVRLCGDVNTTGKRVSGNKVVDELVTSMGVITGERRPSLQQSSYSRVLFLDLDSNPVNLNNLTLLQESKAELNAFLILFVQYVMKNQDFDSNIVNSYYKYRDEFMKNSNYAGMHGRYYGMFAWMAVMWDVYVGLLNQHGVEVDFDFHSELKDYIYSQNNRYDNNPVKLFKIGYFELLDNNELVVIENSSIDDLNFDVMICDDMLFIKSKAVYQKICKYWKEKGIDFPCSERKLRQQLFEVGLLQRKDGKMTTEKKTKENRSYSGYYLFKNFFINYGGIENDNF